MRTTKRLSLAAAMMLAAGAAVSADGVNLPDAARELLRMYPDTDVVQDQGRVLSIYGAPMTPGLNPQAACDLFLAQHAAAFGVGPVTLAQTGSSELGSGRHTVFTFGQSMDGMPVEHGRARVVVLKGPLNRVVYAAATLSPRPAQGWLPLAVTAENAVAIAKAYKAYAKLPVFSVPELVVYRGEGAWTEPTRAWKLVAEEPNLNRREKWALFIDAGTGRLIYARNEVLNDDISGTMKALATPGFLPDEASNPAVLTAIPKMRVSVTGGGSGYSDLTGAFTILNEGTAPVQLTATVGTATGSGKWCKINNSAGAELVATLNNVVPPGPANLVMNSPAGGVNSATTAQVNAFFHTTKIHDFYRDRSGTWANIDVCLPVNVNLGQTCNAFWDGSATNFFSAGGGCVNTAYSDVVGHEYGHFVVQSLGLGQGGFGEGFADCGALLCLDSGPILGRDFQGVGSFVRNVQTANQQYPCSNPDPHVCGQLLGGVWWGIRGNMGTFYGSAPGLTLTQQLFVDWMQITIGGTGGNFNNSANPTTAIEILTINDDDGILSNGTPDYPRICPVFSSHGITCPPAPPLRFVFPNGLPTLIPPNTPQDILMNVEPMSSTPVANTAKFDFRINSGAYTEVSMTQLATANHYKVTIAAQPCNTNIDYYFKARAANNATPTIPSNAPVDAFYVPVADAILTHVADDFETDQGWSGSSPSDTATTGRWTRGVPEETAAQPGADHSANGTMCWITDYHAGQQVSDFDVDDGRTTLTTPLFDASNKLSPRFSFWLWYSNNIGPLNPGTNTFNIEISNNDGTSWFPVRALGPTGVGTTGGWTRYSFGISDYVPPTANMRIRFIASDFTGSIVEAALDDFEVTSLQCPPPFCYANCDGSSLPPVLNVADFACFLNRFQAAESYANCDGSTVAPVLNIADFTCFLNAFSLGCT